MKKWLSQRRVIAVLLCVALLTALLPVAASAAKLDPPKMKKVSCVEKGVKVQWKAVDGAAGYRVFRKDNPKASWKAIADTTNTKYTDRKAKSGKTYYYAIRALDTDGKAKSDLSSNPKSITYYKAPKMTSATVQDDGILVKWKASAGAKLYRVYRDSGSGWKQIGTSKTNQYLDKKVKYGRNYNYMVRVVTANNKTILSDYDHTGVTATFTKRAAISSLTNKDGYVRVTWDKIKGLSQYRLFRKAEGGDWFTVTTTTGTSYDDYDVLNNVKYTYMVRGMDGAGDYAGIYDANGKAIIYFVYPTLLNCVRSGDNLLTTWDAVEGVSQYAVFRRIGGASTKWIRVGTTANTSFTDTTMPSGTYCEYTVASADAAGNIVSAYGVLTVGATSYVDHPILLSISNGIGQVNLSWQPVDKATKYSVYRKIGDDMPQWVYIATVTGTTFSDTSVINLKKYHYTVAVRNAADTADESNYDSNGLTITYYNPPALTKIENAVSGVKISWAKVDGVSSYKIWRWTGSGTWTHIGTAAGTADSYIDPGVGHGAHYWYSVSSVANSESAFTTPGLDINFYEAPIITSFANGDGYMRFTWADVESAVSFKLYRRTSSTADWTLIGTSTGNENIDASVESGKKYEYGIQTVTAGGQSGINGTTLKTYLSKPILNSVDKGDTARSLKIKWDQLVVGATKYNVYYRAYPGGATLSRMGVTLIDRAYTLTGLTSGQKYEVWVQAVAADGSVSVTSATKTGTAR